MSLAQTGNRRGVCLQAKIVDWKEQLEIVFTCLVI